MPRLLQALSHGNYKGRNIMEPESTSQIKWPDSCCECFIQMQILSGKVLIVEDHLDSREILKLQLQALGYEVAVATNGEEALEKALTEAPDIIIMDLGLPGIDGFEATARLKENTKTTKLPVLAYTAWSEDLYRAKAKQAGMEAFLTKPTQHQVINEVIQRVFQTTPQN